MFRHAAKMNLARIGDFNRPLFPFVARVARAAMDRVADPQFQEFVRQFRATVQDITKPKARGKVDKGFGSIDPTASGRAAAASRAVFARYEGLIDEVSRNMGLTPEQRASAILSLRQRQSAEAAAVSKQIMDAAKGAAKRRREMERGRH